MVFVLRFFRECWVYPLRVEWLLPNNIQGLSRKREGKVLRLIYSVSGVFGGRRLFEFSAAFPLGQFNFLHVFVCGLQ